MNNVIAHIFKHSRCFGTGTVVRRRQFYVLAREIAIVVSGVTFSVPVKRSNS